MYTTQTNLSVRSKPDEEVGISLTKLDWDQLTNAVHATGIERERVMKLVDKIRLLAHLPPRDGVEYNLNVYV